jgi:transcriptional regulator with XRE-family HTH domain
LGLRQSDVAERIGVHRGTLNTWENHRFTPQVRHLPRIVAFLGYDPFAPSSTTGLRRPASRPA